MVEISIDAIKYLYAPIKSSKKHNQSHLILPLFEMQIIKG